MTGGPPRIAVRLIRWLAPPGEAAFMLSDLAEEFDEVAMQDGRRQAVSWYWRQTLRSIGPLLGRRMRFDVPVGGASMARRRLRGWSVAILARTVAQDVRYAFRGLARNPLFTAVAVGTLAVGIGANVVIFTVVNAVLLSPPSYDEPDRVLAVFGEREGRLYSVSFPEIDALRLGTRTLEHVSLMQLHDATLLADEPTRVPVALVSADYFEAFGVAPAAGRFFGPDDEAPGRPRAVVLSFPFWQRQYGGDPLTIGRTINLDGVPRTIVGVASQDFVDPFATRELWMTQPDRYGAATRIYKAVARLREGTTLEQARAEVRGIAANVAAVEPLNEGMSATLMPIQEMRVGLVRPALRIFLGAVAAVLLIACANVANLLLSRAAVRSTELAVRSALGGSRPRIVGQLLTESLVLAVLGGVAGLTLGWVGTEVFGAMLESNVPRGSSIRIDGSVTLFALVLTGGTGILFGLLPALKMARMELGGALRGTRGVGDGERLRGSLVVAEIALSLMLLTGAGLLLKSFWRLHRVDKGIATDTVLVMRVAPSEARHPEAHDLTRLYERLQVEVSRVPGVAAVAATNAIPVAGGNWDNAFSRDDRPPAQPGRGPTAQALTVTPGFFAAVGIRLLGGRVFDARDRSDEPQVAIVSRELARRFFPGEDPIGKRITSNGPSREIVGVVSDVRQFGPDQGLTPALYTPYAQQTASWMRRSMWLVARADQPNRLGDEVRRAVWRVDDTMPVSDLGTLDRVFAADTAQQRFRMSVLLVFAAVALLLAAVGIAGVMAYTVARRVREFAIRIALGASVGNVTGLVLRRGLALIALGIVLGVAGAVASSRVLSGMLFDVPSVDPAILLLVTLVLAAVAIGASLLPVRRAIRVDPVSVLRED